jgi:hypothetical protein
MYRTRKPGVRMMPLLMLVCMLTLLVQQARNRNLQEIVTYGVPSPKSNLQSLRTSRLPLAPAINHFHGHIHILVCHIWQMSLPLLILNMSFSLVSIEDHVLKRL